MSYEVLINRSFGGFSFSDTALNWIQSHCKDFKYHLDENKIKLILKAKSYYDVCSNTKDDVLMRHDKILIDCYKELGKDKFSETNLDLKTIQCQKYKIIDYDGNESIITPNDNDWIEIKN